MNYKLICEIALGVVLGGIVLRVLDQFAHSIGYLGLLWRHRSVKLTGSSAR